MFLKLEHRVQNLTITYKNRAKPSFLVKKPQSVLLGFRLRSLRFLKSLTNWAM